MNVYLEEYSANEAVQKYVSDSAGSGIAHLLQHVYGRLYEEQIDKIVAQSGKNVAFRVLEYGCGGGMNLIWIVKRLLDRQLKLDFACGTDFSAKMVEAAKKEASSCLPRNVSDKVSFHTVANENLDRDLPKELGRSLADLQNSFHLIVGVNTFRYCFRLASQAKSAGDIFSLLRPGGCSIMIDMNRSFPLFRSKLRPRFDTPKDQRYLPSLNEYDAVFRQAGFEIETKTNFCWVPHSAGPGMVTALRTLAPVLQTLFHPFAMRSLIVARKPL
ncbi:MAG: class I SAM-dependent methyltransferase [Verrucomicrobia bacterium]|nr:class I SAM-dependent methyltransferase [Verrucomicrobiota bacterium]MBV8376392.1 class I SAM-dependent methyltransferase [Verrucomicrobiota bacterium]